jgi:hypothetical protein
MADLYLCWNNEAIYAGVYAQDVVEPDFYRNKTVPEVDRAEWAFSLPGSAPAIRCRIGAGLEARVNVSEVRLVNISGVNLNVRNISAMELPARLFGKTRFRAGDVIEFSSVFTTQAQGYRTEWRGKFKLAQNP